MYRVELKDGLVVGQMGSGKRFLMYRVELKEKMELLPEEGRSLFLMYRVELKGVMQRRCPLSFSLSS